MVEDFTEEADFAEEVQVEVPTGADHLVSVLALLPGLINIIFTAETELSISMRTAPTIIKA